MIKITLKIMLEITIKIVLKKLQFAGFEFQFFIHLQILASSFYFHLQNQNWMAFSFEAQLAYQLKERMA